MEKEKVTVTLEKDQLLIFLQSLTKEALAQLSADLMIEREGK